MTYKTHRLIGLEAAIGICVATGAGAMSAAVIIPTAYLTSDWPDRLEPDDAMVTGQHRKVTHWLETGLLVAGVAALAATFFARPFALPVFWGVLIGHWGHVVLGDGTTLGGIPTPRIVLLIARLRGRNVKKVFWLIPKRLKRLRIRVRGIPEKIVVRGLVVASTVVIIAAWGHSLVTPNHGRGVLGPALTGEPR